LNSSASIVEDVSVISLGSSVSLSKKIDLSLQYSSIYQKSNRDRGGITGSGVNGSVTIWRDKTNIESPFEIALSIFGSHINYSDFNTTSFGAGITLAYKEELPNTFNAIPLIGFSFLPFNQISGNGNTIVLTDKSFVLMVGLGLFTNIFEQSKFVISPSFSLDNSYNLGATMSFSIIF
jgi:hypothetical protein